MKKILKISIYSIIIAVIMSIIIIPKTSNVAYSKVLPPSEIAMDRSSKRVLFECNANIKRGMASTTKIVTAITVINNCSLTDVVEIDKRSAGVEGSSIYLKVGDKLTVEELLYGLMLRSGNDAATALALHIGGTIEKFACMMNKYAISCGAKNSNFINPHGLSDANHYTTAYDLALITANALENEIFSKIVATKQIKFNSIDGQTRIFVNKNKMLTNYNGANGVKTGFTKADGRCLVSSATRDNFQVVTVVLGCGPMFERSEELLESSFNNFKLYTFAKKDECLGELQVSGSFVKSGTTCLYASPNDIVFPLTEYEKNNINIVMNIPNEIEFPVYKHKDVGEFKIYLENKLLFCEKLYTITEKIEYSYSESLYGVLNNWR